METVEQQNALKDAMARAKEIAAKLKASAPVTDENTEEGNERNEDDDEPDRKKRFTDDNDNENEKGNGNDNNNDNDTFDNHDLKTVAQQVANNLAQQARLGPMQVEEISIPNRIVGMVIGRGGEMINKLQAETGAKVQVASEPNPDMEGEDDGRPVTITGPADAVIKAKTLIAEIVDSGKIPDHLMAGLNEGEYSEDIMLPKGKVGLVIGRGGETIKALQQRAGCRMVLIQDNDTEEDPPEKPLRISGEEEAVLFGKQMVDDLINDRGGPHGFGPRAPFNGGGPRGPWGMGPRGPGGPRHGGPRYGGGPPPGYKDMLIEVPTNRAGLVIGKGGETIRMIKGETNISIQIDRSVPEESPFRVFRVQGTEEMIHHALHIIRDKTSDSSITARDEEGNEIGPAPEYPENEWGGHDGWGQQHNQAGWGQHGGWGQQGWGQQGWRQQGWGQQGWGQHGGWDQSQGWGQWNQQQQQWQQNGQQGQWGQQPAASATTQASAQSYSQTSAASTTTTPTDSTQSSAAAAATTGTQATTAGGQPDYSAAWAAYYQQQQQYYQQYYGQQPPQQQQQTASTYAATAASTAAYTAAASATSATTTPATTNASHAAAMAQYQQQLAEYQKKYGTQAQ